LADPPHLGPVRGEIRDLVALLAARVHIMPDILAEAV
jgi:hypothetical protein